MVNFPNEIVPVVILAGGRATRLQPLSDIYPKALIPIAGIPLIGRILDNFRQEGFRNFIIVHSQESDKLKNYVMNLAKTGTALKVKFIQQDEPKGMVHAIQCAREETEKALSLQTQKFQEQNYVPFFVLSAVDVLLDQPDLIKLVNTHIEFRSSATLAVYKSGDVKLSDTHGNIKLEDEKVVDIIEKPGSDKKIDDYYSIPIYVFTQKILNYLDKVMESSRGELELPTAIKLMLTDNSLIVGTQLCQKRKITSGTVGKYHLTYIKDVLQASFRFLKEEPFDYTGEYPTLIEPVTAKSCIIGDSVLVGPKVYIGKECKIGDYTEISQCILLGNNKIGNNVQIDNAFIGMNVDIPDGSIVKDTYMMENNESQKI